MRLRITLLTLALVSLLVAACSSGPQAIEQPAATAAPAQPTAAPAAQAEPTAAPAADTTAPTAPTTPSTTQTGTMLPEVNPLEVRGDIVTAGSSTVFPLSEAMAVRFRDEGYSGNITIDSIGTGAGFERFCVAGESDVANASRPIRDSEKESCRAIGREPIEFRVGTDALAVVVSAENDFVTDVTLEELALIFSTATNWSDVRPEWPNQAILRFSPGTDSGTFDYFVEAVFRNDPAPLLSASRLQLSEDDNVLVQGVEGSPYAIGYFGFAYYEENKDKLNVLAINGVEGTAENVDAGAYALARPIFIYSTARIMQEKPQVAAFINFYLSYVNEEIGTVGYYPAPAADLEGSKQSWLVAVSATVVTGTMLPEVNPLEVRGDIVSAGSSTVFPLSEAMAVRFRDEGYSGNITIDSIGSGAGFERFCVAGESDIANASRPIRQSEIESCRAIGREPIEFRIGTDALAIVVSAENDFVTDVTLEELALIFGTATNWSDVRPEWPNQAILRFSPGTDSGTFDYFVEAVFRNDPAPLLSASRLQLSEDDNVLVQGVEGSPYAIGYFGFAYYEENKDKLNVLAINGVEGTAENVDAGAYALARPIFIYSTARIMQEKPQVAAFINFYLSYVNEEIGTVGYYPAPAADLEGSKQGWLAGISADLAALPVEEMTEGGLPEVNPLEVTGDIVTAGSSTVFPLSEAMAVRFRDEGYSGNITIDSIGTGAGFERFCVAGESDVANASRPIRDSEKESCRAIGREPIEFRVGTDALAVVVSAENDFVTDVTLEELALIFSTATNWSDVRPEWPNQAILRFSPGTDSGTFDYFVEAVFRNDPAPLLSASRLQLSEDDNVLVQGVEGSPYAIGYFGFAYYEENKDKLNVLAINGVEGTAENVDAGAYVLARPIFIYSTARIMQEKPQVAAFINFYLSFVNEEIGKVGYYPAPAADLEQSKQNWLEAQ